MSHPDRRRLDPLGWIAGGLLGILLGCSGSGPPVRTASRPLPASLQVEGGASQALHLRGEARGPLPGLGPEVEIEAWLRADGWLRAELHYLLPDGRPAHDGLIWTPDLALLVDLRRGGLTVLGERPGELEAEGARFRVEHLVWLGLGKAVAGAQDASWSWTGGEWRGRLDGMGLRAGARNDRDRPAWTEVAWRGAEGETRALRAEMEVEEPTAWGPVPRELHLDGDLLEARVFVKWDVQMVASPGDTLFDPLWRP